LVFVDAKIVMKKDADRPIAFILQIPDPDATQEHIFMARDGVVARDRKTERFVFEDDIGYQSFRQISQRALPFVRKHPAKFTVRPDAEPKRKTFRMIFLTDVGKINVADLILR